MRFLRRWFARRSPLLTREWSAEQHAAADKDFIGKHGENIAAKHLQAQGCRVLYRNYKAPGGGEIDISCRHGKVLAFVEVKARTSLAYGRPALAVTEEKQHLILRGAAAWLRMLDRKYVTFRFDIIEVVLIPGQPPDVNWLQGAFSSAGVAQYARTDDCAL
jgi:putative endonuclease